MCTNCSIDNDKDTLYPESSDHVYMLVRGEEVKYSLETFKVWELRSFDIFTTTTRSAATSRDKHNSKSEKVDLTLNEM